MRCMEQHPHASRPRLSGLFYVHVSKGEYQGFIQDFLLGGGGGGKRV